MNKLLTIEASGMAIACMTARYFNVPVVFAKKAKSKNIDGEVYTSKVQSFTYGREYDITLAKKFLNSGDRVLILDDFLANGAAINGLMSLVEQAGAELVGCAVAIEKGFQGGGDELRAKGINVQSLALIDSMDDGKITFRN